MVLLTESGVGRLLVSTVISRRGVAIRNETFGQEGSVVERWSGQCRETRKVPKLVKTMGKLVRPVSRCQADRR